VVVAGAGSLRVWFDRERLSGIIFFIPLLFMLIFFVVPMALTLVWSVFERTAFWMEPGFSFAAYADFFGSARFENFLFAMLHSAAAVLICFVLGFPIAAFVRRSVPERAQHQAILLFILPFMISEVIRLFALRPVLGRNGLVNTFLQELGVISEPVSALIYTPLGVIIGEVMSFLPFMVFCSFLAMEAVPRYIFEVCDDLGSGLIPTLRRVIIPLAMPGIFAGVIFIFVNGLGVFLIPDILGGPGAVNAGTLVLNAIAALDFPLAMAIAAVMVLMMLVLLYIGHRLFDLTRLLEPVK
jgi:ABC-type spermidine/putrescine transport system permease subunit I